MATVPKNACEKKYPIFKSNHGENIIHRAFQNWNPDYKDDGHVFLKKSCFFICFFFYWLRGYI